MGNFTDGGWLPEDDPIFSEGWTIFVARQMRLTRDGQENEAPAGNESQPLQKYVSRKRRAPKKPGKK